MTPESEKSLIEAVSHLAQRVERLEDRGVYVILDHRHAADRLMENHWFATKEAADAFAEAARIIVRCPDAAIEVRRLSKYAT
jgi:hypothetical protein